MIKISPSRPFHRIVRVDAKIEQQLMKLTAVDQAGQRIGSQIEPHPRRRRQRRTDQCRILLDRGAQIENLLIDLGRARKTTRSV
ncbi:MAG: hypothetical protein WDO24_14070 [Pseudomonadota bacterium]